MNAQIKCSAGVLSVFKCFLFDPHGVRGDVESGSLRQALGQGLHLRRRCLLHRRASISQLLGRTAPGSQLQPKLCAGQALPAAASHRMQATLSQHIHLDSLVIHSTCCAVYADVSVAALGTVA